MAYQIAAMIVGLLLLGGASLWGLNGLNQDYGLALGGYQELRQLFQVGAHLSTAKTLLELSQPQAPKAAEEIEAAWVEFDRFNLSPPPSPDIRLPRPGHDPHAKQLVQQAIVEALNHARAGPQSAQAAADALDRGLAQISALAAEVRARVQENRAAANAKRRATMLLMGVLCFVVVAGALALGVWQYRGVMKPLRDLTHGVRRVAAGQFTQRVQSQGDEEFAGLARDFNRMAGELDGFYHDLEQKVAEKSRELIRSERLASVGYLAAGVAHEINNPLGVISGYAEYSLGRLKQASRDDVEKTLRIICEEAFRCKEITSKLLSLAKPGEPDRHAVDLAAVCNAVTSIIGGLQPYRDRKMTVHTDAVESTVVFAVEAEMKQMLMNLLLNALEAVPPGGEVHVSLARDGQWVSLVVSDNGRGMSPDTLQRIFEPFFTDRRTPRDHGTGLGLAITYAIVQNHGGRIRAHSDGPGRGSRFVVELPAAQREPAE